MKKILSILTIFILVLSACSSDSSNTDGTEITLWTNGTQYFLGEEKVDENGNTYRDEDTAVFQHAADAFKEETGITVNFETIASGNEQVDALVKNEDPSVDIYAAPPVMIDDDIVEYMTPSFDSVESCTEMYTESACELAVQSDGQVYAQVPSVGYDTLIVYNKDVVSQAGYDEIPQDMNGFMQMLEDIKANDVNPIAIHRIENWPLTLFDNVANYYANEPDQIGEMLKYDDPFSLDNPYGQSESFMAEIVSNEYTESETYADFGVAMDSVAYGDSGLVMFGSWIIPQIEARIPEDSDAEIGVAPFPMFEGEDELNVAVNPDIPFFIPKGTDSPEEAQMFIDYLSHDPDVQSTFGGTPSVADMTGLEDASSEQVQYIADMVNEGTVTELPVPYYLPNKLNSQEVLKDMGVFADFKYHGQTFDTATNEGYDAAIEGLKDLNESWKNAKEAGDYQYQE